MELNTDGTGYVGGDSGDSYDEPFYVDKNGDKYVWNYNESTNKLTIYTPEDSYNGYSFVFDFEFLDNDDWVGIDNTHNPTYVCFFRRYTGTDGK